MSTKNKQDKKVADDSALKGMANKIMESGQQIWLAGLGAFAKAQEEGSKLYDALVKEGSALEKITTKYTSGKVEEVRGAVENTVSQVKDRAADTWDKLEKVFEDRVGRALGGLGIPNRDELNDLAKRVDDLAKVIKGNTKAAPKATAPAPVAKKPAAKKPAVKKAVVKAVASKKPAVAKKVASTLAKASKATKRAIGAVSKAVKA
jgi:poly(hydroxyalkanoate) granule-associated protein